MMVVIQKGLFQKLNSVILMVVVLLIIMLIQGMKDSDVVRMLMVMLKGSLMRFSLIEQKVLRIRIISFCLCMKFDSVLLILEVSLWMVLVCLCGSSLFSCVIILFQFSSRQKVIIGMMMISVSMLNIFIIEFSIVEISCLLWVLMFLLILVRVVLIVLFLVKSCGKWFIRKFCNFLVICGVVLISCVVWCIRIGISIRKIVMISRMMMVVMMIIDVVCDSL